MRVEVLLRILLEIVLIGMLGTGIGVVLGAGLEIVLGTRVAVVVAALVVMVVAVVIIVVVVTAVRVVVWIVGVAIAARLGLAAVLGGTTVLKLVAVEARKSGAETKVEVEGTVPGTRAAKVGTTVGEKAVGGTAKVGAEREEAGEEDVEADVGGEAIGAEALRAERAEPDVFKAVVIAVVAVVAGKVNVEAMEGLEKAGAAVMEAGEAVV